MVKVLADCQKQYDSDTQGLYGFIGGQPLKSVWMSLYTGDIAPFRGVGGWVPFYVQHKILAGLRDAWLYGGNETAKDLFRKMADWSVNVVSRVSTTDMENLLNTEHGGMNEVLADAYQLFGDTKYLTAAKRFTHKTMLNGMQQLNETFLDGKHANTQVPKYIGMERVYELDNNAKSYAKAAENFWTDVACNRTVCIGGNSVGEHFLSKANAHRYIDQLDGPETCNSNNMLKLSEMLNDRTGDAKYADFYEYTMWNHILSTQDPETGGYVYFTTLRPQGYRIYSQVNQGMWCCVGTGMENHSKYGHFIYTHQGNDVLYVNLFTPSKLESEHFAVTQETLFPNINPVASNIPTALTVTTTITVNKAGSYTIAVRHPAWAGAAYTVMVNGQAVTSTVEQGKASYVNINRSWQVGDRITVWLPMELNYVECPGYSDYIAFRFGPILLAAKTTAVSAEEAAQTGLAYEQLQNEYAGEGRMDHAPGSRASSKNLTAAPLLIGNRSEVLNRITYIPGDDLRFTLDASRDVVSSYQWNQLTLQPFYQIHHARYACYWYQQTEENYAVSAMAQSEAENEALATRTLDFVAPGEQQSEAGHEARYSSDSSTGEYNTERYRDTRANGYIQYTLYNPDGMEENLSILLRFNLADRGRKATLTVDGEQIADITIPSSAKHSDSNGFYNAEFPIPTALAKGKRQFVVRLTASSSTLCPGIYYVRLMKNYDSHAYRFVATDWTTGDTGRLAASNMSFDTEANTITVRQTGTNNVCLMLKYENLDYSIDAADRFLVVRGTNLATTTGASYLWWLNGSNHGTQVAPAQVRSVEFGGAPQTVVAWNMPSSGIYENMTGERPNVCLGQTIFGLTSTTGVSVIHDINFTNDVDKYISTATAVSKPYEDASPQDPVYDLQGRRLPASGLQPGVYIGEGGKKLIRRS